MSLAFPDQLLLPTICFRRWIIVAGSCSNGGGSQGKSRFIVTVNLSVNRLLVVGSCFVMDTVVTFNTGLEIIAGRRFGRL